MHSLSTILSLNLEADKVERFKVKELSHDGLVGAAVESSELKVIRLIEDLNF